MDGKNSEQMQRRRNDISRYSMSTCIPIINFFLSYIDEEISLTKAVDNKSTANGATYARSSVIFPHRMTFFRGRLMQ